MPALKPGLFPLPVLRCLLFLPSAFHSGFNSPQTLPNGFFTWGSEAAHRLPKISRTPRAQKGAPFPTLPPLSAPPSGHAYGPLYTAGTKAAGWAAALRAGPIVTPGGERLCQHPLEPVPSGTRSIPPALTRGTALSSPPSELGGRGDGQRRSAPPSSGCGTRPLPTTPPSVTPSVPISHRHPPPLLAAPLPGGG